MDPGVSDLEACSPGAKLPVGVPTLYWVYPNILVSRGRAPPPGSLRLGARNVGSRVEGKAVPVEIGEHGQQNFVQRPGGEVVEGETHAHFS